MMKRFKFLSALFVGLIGLVSFGYCLKIDVQVQTISPNKTLNLGSGWCVQLANANCCSLASFYDTNGNLLFTGNSSVGYTMYCMDQAGYYLNGHTAACTARYYNYSNYCPTCSTCEDQYTSQECQQEYSLMPISSCNSEYCGLNGLCPEYTGSTMSELYINGINHLGAPIINISIPLEQAWDYNYTGDVMNINLSGENNVDYEYMDNIIRTQHSTPNDTDFNNTISGLIPLFVPGLVIILFIIFVFRFLKKIF